MVKKNDDEDPFANSETGPLCLMKKELHREISFGICPTMMSFSSSSAGYTATAYLSCKLPLQNRKCWSTVNDNYL